MNFNSGVNCLLQVCHLRCVFRTLRNCQLLTHGVDVGHLLHQRHKLWRYILQVLDSLQRFSQFREHIFRRLANHVHVRNVRHSLWCAQYAWACRVKRTGVSDGRLNLRRLESDNHVYATIKVVLDNSVVSHSTQVSRNIQERISLAKLKRISQRHIYRNNSPAYFLSGNFRGWYSVGSSIYASVVWIGSKVYSVTKAIHTCSNSKFIELYFSSSSVIHDKRLPISINNLAIAKPVTEIMRTNVDCFPNVGNIDGFTRCIDATLGKGWNLRTFTAKYFVHDLIDDVSTLRLVHELVSPLLQSFVESKRSFHPLCEHIKHGL